MMKAVVPLAILIFASMLTRCFSSRVCDVTKCTDSKGVCYRSLCLTVGPKCGDGDSCNNLYKHIHISKRPICVNGSCIDDVCTKTTNGMLNLCSSRGVRCKGDNYCQKYEKCITGTCRSPIFCGTDGDGASCNRSGKCRDGICWNNCTNIDDCYGKPCVDGFCASVYCGESYCNIPRTNN